MKKALSLLLAVLLVCSLMPTAFAADYYFTDRNGNQMMAPDGAFATQVVQFIPGNPWTKVAEEQKTSNALGQPDYKEKSGIGSGDLTLGAGGVLVLKFDVAIYDGDGLDIYVFEVGDDVEPTKVEVSQDLYTWYEVGTASGKTAGVDLNGKVPAGARFSYVRLTDLKKYPNSRWPGADIDAVSGLNVKPHTSGWAETEIDRAEELNLIPDVLKNKDMTQKITRAEFAAVSVKVYEALSGTKAIPAVNNPFVDTKAVDVLKAYNVGVVNGISATEFAPNSLLNREEAATMLTRVFKRVTLVGWTLPTDSQFTLSYVKPAPFADDALISGWAKDSVYFMAANHIINGMGDNTFAPRNTTTQQQATGYANATREQALAIAVRMVDNL